MCVRPPLERYVQMLTRSRHAGFALIAAVAIIACGLRMAPVSAATAVVKIGVELPLSGADASQGTPMLDGVLLAAAQANAKAPKGLTFKVTALDEAVGGVHNPQQGATNVKSFSADTGVLGILGPLASNVAAAEIPIVNAAGIALISGSATNPDLTKTQKLRTTHPNDIDFFRVCATDDLQGAVGAQFAKEQGYKKVYVIDDNETYGKGLADVFAASFAKLGGDVLGHDHVTPNQQDFRALLTKVAATNPDAVFFGGVTATGGLLIRQQMSSAGLDPAKVAYLGGDGFQDPAYPQQAGAAGNNTYYTAATPNLAALPAARKFVADYKKRFGNEPSAYSANYYVAAQVLINAIEKSMKAYGGKVPTRALVLKELRETKNFPSILGTFSFDRNGDTTNPLFSIFAIKNQKEVWIKQIIAKRK